MQLHAVRPVQGRDTGRVPDEMHRPAFEALRGLSRLLTRNPKDLREPPFSVRASDDRVTCDAYVDGNRLAVLETLRFLKAYSHNEGFKRVYAFACNTPLISEALIESGFTLDDQNTEFIYEKTLTPHL